MRFCYERYKIYDSSKMVKEKDGKFVELELHRLQKIIATKIEKINFSPTISLDWWTEQFIVTRAHWNQIQSQNSKEFVYGGCEDVNCGALEPFPKYIASHSKHLLYVSCII